MIQSWIPVYVSTSLCDVRHDGQHCGEVDGRTCRRSGVWRRQQASVGSSGRTSSPGGMSGCRLWVQLQQHASVLHRVKEAAAVAELLDDAHLPVLNGGCRMLLGGAFKV